MELRLIIDAVEAQAACEIDERFLFAQAAKHLRGGPTAGFERMKDKVAREAALAHAKTEIADTLDDRFAALQRDDEIEKLLGEIKSRQQATN